MPTRQFTVTTTPTEIASENPRRVVLAIKNCTGIGVPIGEFMRVSDDKSSVAGGNLAFLLWPGDTIVLQKCDGDNPEKAWWGATESLTACCCVIESFEVVK